ncbi:unnamed protein product [Mytilus coruscus]|uniref:MULE transposase domain-containing protein n=1 Tax=Mytilus coruscus TaxID=42192 RepID=A0A6J8C769_MYTCO|nr:unnamed protein product [Mytilus coruscus]
MYTTKLEYDFLTQNTPNFICKDLTVVTATSQSQDLVHGWHSPCCQPSMGTALLHSCLCEVWFIDRRLPEDISLDGFVADFEAGLWQALKQRFPRYAIQGCAIHWSQAVFRKVQEHGLQTVYNQKDSVNTFLRQLMALPFLPPEHITDTFLQLDARAPQAIVPHHLPDPPLSVFMSAIRTNNDVEGWHNRFNTNVATRGPVPFYQMVTELFAEAGDIPLQLKLVSEGKLQCYQRKKSRQVQGKVFSLWNDYCERTTSASNLLRECAAIYGPPAK